MTLLMIVPIPVDYGSRQVVCAASRFRSMARANCFTLLAILLETAPVAPAQSRCDARSSPCPSCFRLLMTLDRLLPDPERIGWRRWSGPWSSQRLPSSLRQSPCGSPLGPTRSEFHGRPPYRDKIAAREPGFTAKSKSWRPRPVAYVALISHFPSKHFLVSGCTLAAYYSCWNQALLEKIWPIRRCQRVT